MTANVAQMSQGFRVCNLALGWNACAPMGFRVLRAPTTGNQGTAVELSGQQLFGSQTFVLPPAKEVYPFSACWAFCLGGKRAVPSARLAVRFRRLCPA